VFACVGWKVTLCDPIWQVTLRSCEMDIYINSYTALYFYFLPATEQG